MRATITLDTLDTSSAIANAHLAAPFAAPQGPLPAMVHVIEGTSLAVRFEEKSKAWHITDGEKSKGLFSQFHVVSITVD